MKVEKLLHDSKSEVLSRDSERKGGIGVLGGKVDSSFPPPLPEVKGKKKAEAPPVVEKEKVMSAREKVIEFNKKKKKERKEERRRASGKKEDAEPIDVEDELFVCPMCGNPLHDSEALMLHIEYECEKKEWT